MAWIECPECDTGCEGGTFGDPAWCPQCEVVYNTDWDYTNVIEGSMAAWIVGPGQPMSAEEWHRAARAPGGEGQSE